VRPTTEKLIFGVPIALLLVDLRQFDIRGGIARVAADYFAQSLLSMATARAVSERPCS